MGVVCATLGVRQQLVHQLQRLLQVGVQKTFNNVTVFSDGCIFRGMQ